MSKVVVEGDVSMGTNEVEQEADVPMEPAKEMPVFSVRILEITRKAQMQNGLRQGDHRRYRQYCSRRLTRLRRSLKVTQNKRHTLKIELDVAGSEEERLLLVPLMNAERCWAMGMELKSDSTQAENRVRFHIHRRLAKAVRHSASLLAMCRQRADERSIIEAEAYHNAMQGTIALEDSKWESALSHFRQARTVYDKLGRIGTTSATAPLYTQRVEELDPIIRFCGYNISREGGTVANEADLLSMGGDGSADTLLREKLDHALEETRRRQAQTMEAVEWRGATVPVRNDKVRVSVLESEAELKKCNEESELSKKMPHFDKVVMTLNDALTALRSDLIQLMTDKPAGHEEKEAEVEQVKAFIAHRLLKGTVQRNMAILANLRTTMAAQATLVTGRNKYAGGKPVTPDEIVSCCELLIQNMQEFGALPRAESDSVEQAAVGVATVIYKGVRCYFMAQTYNNNEKWAEAVALFSRAREYVPEARELLRGADAAFTAQLVDTTLLDWLDSACIAGMSVPRANALLRTAELTDGVQGIALEPSALMDRLGRFSLPEAGVAPTVIDFPPSLEPIPARSVLFDLAHDFISFPDLSKRKPQRRGLLSGFW